MSDNPKGPFTLWEDYGHEGWDPTDFVTLAEALEAKKHCTNWVVTRPVEHVIPQPTETKSQEGKPR